MIGPGDPYKIPFLLGVVGHRDLVPAEIPAIRSALTDLLQHLVASYPDITFSLLCSMADGADLLAADVGRELGIPLVALLPFPQANCRADLPTPAARETFDRACADAEIQELPLRDGISLQDVARDGGQRDERFQRAGSLIARYSGLLIAIWDGKETGHRAGTARVIDYRRSATVQPADDEALVRDALLSVRDNDLIYEIRCSRNGATGAAEGTGEVHAIGYSGTGAAGGNEIPYPLQATLQRIAEFNRDVRRFGRQIAQDGQRLTPPTPFPVPDRLQYLDRLFSASDWLSRYFHRAFARALRTRYALWAVMAFLLLSFKKDSDDAAGLLTIAGVLVVFGLGGGLAVWAHRRSWQRKYLDYRALAEGLRVDFYWEIAGVRRQFDGEFAHESFLQKQDVDLEWIRAAMRTVSFRLAMRPGGPFETGFAQAYAAWIGDADEVNGGGQLLFYKRRTRTLRRNLELKERIGRALLFGGLILAVAFTVDIALGMTAGPTLPAAVRGAMLWALALLTVYAAIFEIYLTEKSDRALIRQYEYMYSLFGFAASELKHPRSATKRAEILRSLGHACLAEHAQWILMHRDKRIDGLRW